MCDLMLFTVAIVSAASIDAGSAFTGLIGAIAALSGVQIALMAKDLLEPSSLLVGLVGIMFCIFGLVFSVPILEFVALAFCISAFVITAIALWQSSAPFLLAAWLPRGALARGAVVAVCLVVVAGIGFAVGFLISGSSSTVVAASGPYHVDNTCFDGNCTVNVCRSHERCGEDNVGELKQGKAVDIECQTRGGPVHGSAGETSHIWDRLPSGFYINDLFVRETRKHDQFTKTIPRCADG